MDTLDYSSDIHITCIDVKQMTKRKLTEDEIQENLEKVRTGEMKIVPAPRKITKVIGPYIAKVLEAIGHPEAWVSDMSSIGDFAPMNFGDEESEVDEYQEFVDKVSLKLNMKVEKGEGVVDIAMRLMAQEEQDN